MTGAIDRSVINVGTGEKNNSNNVAMNEDHSKINNRYLLLMNNYRKEIFLSLLIIVRVAFSAIERSIPVISPAPYSGPLFSINSNVQDWYGGQLEGAFYSIGHYEYSFFMYYAPWDAKSQYAAKVVNEVADIFKDRINFLAINCWAPGGECRDKHTTKVQSWPIFYIVNCYGGSIQYRGPISKSHMTRFLNTALTLCTGLLSQMIFYDILYKTALKWIDHEPYNEIGFAVVTGHSRDSFGVNSLPSYRIYLWNETLIYESDKVPNTNNLFTWISSNLHQVSMWINFPGVKSSTLSPYLMEGSALLLFTPRNAFREFNDAYDMLKHIGLEYYNCNNDPWVAQLSKYIQLTRAKNQERYYEKVKFCEELLAKSNNQMRKNVVENIEVSITVSKWFNTSKDPNNNVCSVLDKHCFIEKYENEKHGEHIYDRCNKNDAEKKIINNFSKVDDYYSAENLHKIKETNECLLLLEADLQSKPVFFETNYNKDAPNISGLACQNNRSLSLLALDSEMYHYIAEKIGVQLLDLENKTVVLIIDNENRSFRDNSKTSQYTHKYSTEKNVYQSMKQYDRNLGIVSVAELSSNTFIPQVMNQNKTVVVLYYSPFCGFCQYAWHIFLYVSHLLKSISKISFVRIDMDYNDVPWQLTMDDLPTITIFPESKSESLTFPHSLDITASNVLSFILSNLNNVVRLEVMIKVCIGTYKMSDQHMTCWFELQREILRLIEITLKQWRISNNHYKSVLVRRLQLLKTLSFLTNPGEKSPSKIKEITNLINQISLNSRFQKFKKGLR
ncbi:thioredoxin domain-containing protein 11-like [Ctenocephalides felis]|uniref:thioredoxin domain-containing protein 11-like n=1 Tax=Ctenocephalides felis TaxID=7515 RepID=UPI000E6E2FB8|nr:thioredoxin domain-containing protein 11-like [Ctenocephalides felis]